MSGPPLSRARHELMRRIARFSGVRRMTMARARRQPALPLPALPPGAADPVLADAAADRILADPGRDGLAPHLALRPQVVESVLAWAARQPCHADENPAHGLLPGQRRAAKAALGRPILKAVYSEPERHCPAMRALHGPAGLGFVEDTFGLHTAQSPSVHPRLLISLVFQLRDDQLAQTGPRDTRLLVPAKLTRDRMTT